MARALWQGQVIAETDTYETVEGNVYFPPGSVNRAFLSPSETTTVCGWKGTAHYYAVEVGGRATPMPRGITPTPSPRPRPSATTSPSGAASRSRPEQSVA